MAKKYKNKLSRMADRATVESVIHVLIADTDTDLLDARSEVMIRLANGEKPFALTAEIKSLFDAITARGPVEYEYIEKTDDMEFVPGQIVATNGDGKVAVVRVWHTEN
jgi:hypothetical protein